MDAFTLELDRARPVLITGSAGFIGYALATRLLNDGFHVVGIDAITDYGGKQLKRARLAQLMAYERYSHETELIETPGLLNRIMADHAPEVVFHFAAQAGVRYSIEAPEAYVNANMIGTFRLLEAARAHCPKHLLLASTSSAYGASSDMPYRETQKADFQMSFYAATKKATEAMAHSYAHLYDLPITMLRFFTVYGPWGRPDMAPMLFADAAYQGRPIRVFNNGRMKRDFTFIDDLVKAAMMLANTIPIKPDLDTDLDPIDSLSPVAPFRIVNIGNSNPIELMTFISAIEDMTGRKLRKIFEPIQTGDVPATWAEVSLLKKLTGFEPNTALSEGVAKFIEWYRKYHGYE